MNRHRLCGVLLERQFEMHERAERLAEGFLTVDEQLEREFDLRLVESARLIFRVAFSVLRHREDAEDVAQEALVKAYAGFARLRDPGRFRAWVVRIAWRLAINRQREIRRRLAREQRATSPLSRTPLECLNATRRAAALWDAIDALPEKLRLVVVLAGIEGHDMREVGRLLGLPEGTVKSRLFLARQKLREYLQ